MRRLAWILAGLVMLAALALAVVVSQRERLAERALLDRLAALGIPVAGLRVESLDAQRIVLRDVRLGRDDELRIGELEAAYSSRSLAAGRVDSLRASDIDWRLAWTQDGLSLGTLGGAGDEPTETSAGAPRLPFDAAQLDELRLRATTPFGEIAASGRVHFANDSARIEADVAPFRTAPESGEPVEVPGLEISARVVPDGSVLGFDVGVCHLEAGALLHASGQHDLDSGAGSARLRLDPLVFAKGGLQPRHLHPLAGGWISDAAGAAEASGELRWDAASGVTGEIALVFRDLDLASPLVVVDRINAALRVDGPWPPRIPDRQLLSMARLDFGIELVDGLVSYRLEPDGVLYVERAEWKFAGGRVLTGGRFDPTSGEQNLLLAVDDVDLGRLFELVELEGLSGEGRIGGRLPLRQRGGVLEIRQAMLAGSHEGGTIRYRPDSGVAGMAGGQPGLDQALAALRNFHWTELWLTLDGEARGEVRIGLHIAGSNPEYHGGHPVEFNLNLEGHLMDLLGNASMVYALPAAIEKRIAELSGEVEVAAEAPLPIACRRQP